MTTDPYVRVVDQIEDMNGRHVYLGVDYDTVTIHLDAYIPGRGVRLESTAAEDLARAYTAACIEAGRQAGTAAQAAEFRAAAEEICLADCGGKTHDHACLPLPASEGTPQ